MNDQKLIYRASFINNPKTNPYVKSIWSQQDISDKINMMPSVLASSWFKTIEHLQSFAFRYHLKTCQDPVCLGCGDDRELKMLELRFYFHRKQCEFISFAGNEAWMITGRRFGKTESMVFYVACRLLGYNPITNELYDVPQNWWLIGLDYPSLRDTVIETFRRIMPPESAKWNGDANAWDFKRADLMAKIYNESSVVFKSCESGASKFQGTGLDGAAFDEEPVEDVYRETRMRIKGGKDLIIRGAMTPNPKLGLTWTYKKILKNEERIQKGLLKIWTGSSYENKCIKKNLLDAISEDLEEWEKQVRIEGNYSAGLGRSAFNIDSLYEMIDKSSEAGQKELIAGCLFSIWEFPLTGESYIIGADPAEGLTNGDKSAACILKRSKLGRLSIVATFVGIIDPDSFGKELISMAKFYNMAWIICEVNNHGYTTITTMQKMEYLNLYTNSSQEDLQGVSDSRKLGWYTNILKRQILVDDMAKLIRERELNIPDKDTIDELMSFIYDKKNKPQAQSGCRDDRVFALGLAIQGHLRCPWFSSTPVAEETIKVKHWFIYDEERMNQKERELAWMRA